MAFVYLLPDSEAPVRQWSPFPAGPPVVHWDKVDDIIGVPDEDGTYVYTTTSNLIEDFNHVTSALLIGATITNVRVIARMRFVPTGIGATASVNLGLRIILIRYPAGFSIPITSSYVDYTWDWANHPATANPWVKSDIDTLMSSTQAINLSNAIERCTQIYFRVTYTPAPPAVTPVAGKGLVSWTP